MSTVRWGGVWSTGVLALIGALALGCRGPETRPAGGPAPAATSTPGGGAEAAPRELRVVYHAPKTLDWTAGADTEATALARNLYEGLRVMTPDGKGTGPGAAGEPAVSADGRTFTFHLRDDARWSDGTPVEAADFVEAWAHCLGAGAQCGVLEPFEKLLAAPDGGFEAIDERTLRVRLAKPHPLTPFALATTAFLPVPRAVRAAHPANWMLPPQGVSNGPWRLAAYRPGVEAVLEPNAHHRGAKSLKLDRVRVTFAQTQQNGDDLFRSGAADLVFGMIPIERVRALLAKADPSLVVWPAACTALLGLNNERGPTADVAFRRALAAAVDREKLALQVLGMGQVPAMGFTPPDLWQDPPSVPPDAGFSPNRAREAYRQSAHAATPDAPVPYLLNEDAGNRLIAQALQRDVKETLGIGLELQSLEWGALNERLARGEFAVVRMAWCAVAPDPAAFTSLFRSTSPENPSRYRNAEFDTTLDRLIDAPTEQAREAIVAEAEARLAADVAAIPLYHYARALLVRPCLKGLTANAFDLQYFDHVDLSGCQGE
jgi:oligopeptide transport system substrate-binding protein